MRTRLKDRCHAGRLLARRLAAHARRADAIVLALPRGGVPPGYIIAAALGLPLDVLQVRKLGLPGQPEFAIGAVGGDGACLVNTDALRHWGLPPALVAAEAAREQQVIARRQRDYRAGRPPPQLRGKTAILVDDGIATGATMRMAVRLARQGGAANIIVAVPVAPPEVRAALAAEVDELVCLRTPSPFYSVGHWYRDFAQVSDEQVAALLARAWSGAAGDAGPAPCRPS